MKHRREKAEALVASARTTIASTKLGKVMPVSGRGVQFTTTHALPPGHGHVEGYLQVHPHQLHGNTYAQGTLAAIHNGLVRGGRQPIAMLHPSTGVTFKNGPQP